MDSIRWIHNNLILDVKKGTASIDKGHFVRTKKLSIGAVLPIVRWTKINFKSAGDRLGRLESYSDFGAPTPLHMYVSYHING